MRTLFFDTETTGLPKDRRIAALSAPDNWPDIVSISWVIFEGTKIVQSHSYIVSPDEWTIPPESTAIHGITPAFASRNGFELDYVLEQFRNDIYGCDVVVAHNLSFDLNVVDSAWYWRVCRTRRLARPPFGWPKIQICTAEYGKDICRLPFARGGPGFRYPKLAELYTKILGRSPSRTLHCSLNDTLLLAELFFVLPPLRPHLKGETLCLDIQNGDYPVRAPAPQSRLSLDLSGGDV
jgi:DNA polymerase III epsilon subunit-like protein